MIRTIVFSGALTFALAGAALAQTDTGATAWATRAAVPALRGAYRAIGEAQAFGASPYLDAAKSHYRNALERYAKADPGAAAEAAAAVALARAAEAEHPAPAPRDVPPPPELAAVTPVTPAAPTAMRPQMHAGPWQHRQRGFANRFDAARLAADAKLAGTAEASDLAQKALDADLARTKAAFAGHMEEAQRDGRLAGALASAVRSLAYAEHPPTFRRRAPGGST